MKTLFIIPGACSFGSMVALEWINEPYQIGITTAEIRASQAFKAINPLGKVGALQDGETLVYENLAILLYLVDKYPNSKIAISINTKERIETYKWLSYLSSTLHVAFSPLFNPTAYVEASILEPFKQGIINRLRNVLSYLNTYLNSTKYFISDKPTTVDAQAYGLLRWLERFGLGQEYTGINEFMARMKQLPEVNNALQIEQQNTNALNNSSFAGYYTFA